MLELLPLGARAHRVDDSAERRAAFAEEFSIFLSNHRVDVAR